MSKKQFERVRKTMVETADHYPDCPQRGMSMDTCHCWERHLFEAGKRAGIHAERSRILEAKRPEKLGITR